MPKALRVVLQYVIMIAITVALVWLSLGGLTGGAGENKTDLILKAWHESNKWWLLAMSLVGGVSHLMRAERWRMLLVPSGNKVGLGNSFLSLLIGYLVNLAVPRGGEISRCYNLYKLEGTPVEVSFGTVVIERIVDVLCLLAAIVLAFLFEWKSLVSFIGSLGIGSSTSTGFSLPWWIIAGIVGLIALAVAAYLLRKNERLIKLVTGFRDGLLSIFRLEKKWLFIFYSIAIWCLYFMMSYSVIQAFDTTAHLGFEAVLTLFALGAIAMAAPLPGGAGSYHTIVPAGLVMLYNINRPDAVAFVFIFHAWQTLNFIVLGFVSLIISYLLIRWKKQPAK
jgi:uncharacterized protein (TIRG00374 family)